MHLKYQDLINPSKASLTRLQNDLLSYLKMIRDNMILYFSLENRDLDGSSGFYSHRLIEWLL